MAYVLRAYVVQHYAQYERHRGHNGGRGPRSGRRRRRHRRRGLGSGCWRLWLGPIRDAIATGRSAEDSVFVLKGDDVETRIV